uniref:C2H2-type domain-containing protein n=1 Tax=Fagus sylvatica TaxID=28930 RepID=A0A2N9EX21_FAGSY
MSSSQNPILSTETRPDHEFKRKSGKGGISRSGATVSKADVRRARRPRPKSPEDKERPGFKCSSCGRVFNTMELMQGCLQSHADPPGFSSGTQGVPEPVQEQEPGVGARAGVGAGAEGGAE